MAKGFIAQKSSIGRASPQWEGSVPAAHHHIVSTNIIKHIFALTNILRAIECTAYETEPLY
jgi:hypothetical protein